MLVNDSEAVYVVGGLATRLYGSRVEFVAPSAPLPVTTFRSNATLVFLEDNCRCEVNVH